MLEPLSSKFFFSLANPLHCTFKGLSLFVLFLMLEPLVYFMLGTLICSVGGLSIDSSPGRDHETLHFAGDEQKVNCHVL